MFKKIFIEDYEGHLMLINSLYSNSLRWIKNAHEADIQLAEGIFFEKDYSVIIETLLVGLEKIKKRKQLTEEDRPALLLIKELIDGIRKDSRLYNEFNECFTALNDAFAPKIYDNEILCDKHINRLNSLKHISRGGSVLEQDLTLSNILLYILTSMDGNYLNLRYQMMELYHDWKTKSEDKIYDYSHYTYEWLYVFAKYLISHTHTDRAKKIDPKAYWDELLSCPKSMQEFISNFNEWQSNCVSVWELSKRNPFASASVKDIYSIIQGFASAGYNSIKQLSYSLLDFLNKLPISLYWLDEKFKTDFISSISSELNVDYLDKIYNLLNDLKIQTQNIYSKVFSLEDINELETYANDVLTSLHTEFLKIADGLKLNASKNNVSIIQQAYQGLTDPQYVQMRSSLFLENESQLKSRLDYASQGLNEEMTLTLQKISSLLNSYKKYEADKSKKDLSAEFNSPSLDENRGHKWGAFFPPAVVPEVSSSSVREASNRSIISPFTCPISSHKMEDPVTAPDGRTYDRSSLQALYNSDQKFLLNEFNEKIPLPNPENLATNYFIKSLIDSCSLKAKTKCEPLNSNNIENIEIKEDDLLCPISFELMEDPVNLEEWPGKVHVYDRNSLQELFDLMNQHAKGSATCPLNREKQLPDPSTLETNLLVKKLCDQKRSERRNFYGWLSQDSVAPRRVMP